MGVAALLEIGGIMLLGLPGGLFAMLAEPVVAALRGMPGGELLAGDRAWPTAIVMTLAVPPAIPVSHLLTRMLRPQWNAWLQLVVMAAATYAWSIVVLFGLTV